MADEQGISLDAYAKHRNISRQAVSKEVRRGRLKGCVSIIDGRPRITDVAAADREWEAGSRRPAAWRPTAAPAAPASPPLNGFPITPATDLFVTHRQGYVIWGVGPGENIDLKRTCAVTRETARDLAQCLWLMAKDDAKDTFELDLGAIEAPSRTM